MTAPRPLRIGMISQSLSRQGGGVSEALRLYGDAIMATGEGHVLHVFAPHDADSARDSALYAGWQVHLAKAYGPRRFAFSPGLVTALLRADIDVLQVHGVWQAHGLAAWIWHLRTGRPLVISPHGMFEPWIMQRSARAKTALSALFQDAMLRGSAVIHALTQAEREQSSALYPAHRDVEVVPNYVALRSTDGLARPDWWPQRYDGRRIFLFFGRLHAKKGLFELCDAWERLSADPHFAARNALVICGWVDDDTALAGRLADLEQATDSFLFAGPQFGEDRWRAMAAADFVVLPSKSEGLPMGVLEAWGMGKPMIMTEACNLPEGFAAGAAMQCGQSVEEIAQALSAAAALPAQDVARMGGAAQSLIIRDFSQESFARRLLALLRRAVGTA
jgi:glycosyltransferase involved in cell wall biosynthesis